MASHAAPRDPTPTTAIFVTPEEAELLNVLRRLLAPLRGHPGPSSLDPFERALLVQILQEIRSMSATFDSEMAQLKADVAQQTTVIASATAAFQGLAAQLIAAEEAAITAGASADQIAGLTSVRQAMEANTAALSAAIPANTPAASATTGTEPATPAPATPEPAMAPAP